VASHEAERRISTTSEELLDSEAILGDSTVSERTFRHLQPLDIEGVTYTLSPRSHPRNLSVAVPPRGKPKHPRIQAPKQDVLIKDDLLSQCVEALNSASKRSLFECHEVAVVSGRRASYSRAFVEVGAEMVLSSSVLVDGVVEELRRGNISTTRIQRDLIGERRQKATNAHQPALPLMIKISLIQNFRVRMIQNFRGEVRTRALRLQIAQKLDELNRTSRRSHRAFSAE
jgi:hypothetical protein